MSAARLPALVLPLLLSVPAAAEPVLTLDECMRVVRDSHPSLTRSREEVTSSRQGVKSARSSFFPRAEVSFGTDLWRRRLGEEQVTGVVPGIESEPRTSVSLSWKVLGARNPLEYSRSLIEYERSEMLHLDTRRDLESALVSVYYAFLQAQMVSDLQTRVYELQKDEYDLDRKKVEMGSSSPLEAISGEEALLATRIEMINADESRRRSAADLSALLGKECPVDQPLEDLDQAPPPGADTEDEWVASALQHREELIAQRAAARSAEKNVSIALWERLPDVNIGLEYGLNRDSFYGTGSLPVTIENLDRGASWAFGVGASVPLFTGGSLTARHARAKSALAQAHAAALLIEREVERDVRAAWARYRTAREALEIRTREVELAGERLEYIRRLFEAGTRYQKNDWQRARVNVARKDVALVRARVGARESWVHLLRAAGLPLDAKEPILKDTKEVREE